MAEDLTQRVTIEVALDNQLAAGRAAAEADIAALGDKVNATNTKARENVERDRAKEVAAIELLQGQLTELAATRASADAAAVAGIDREIVAVRGSVEAHYAEIAALEAKRIKLEQTALLGASTSDAERVRIKANADAQLAANTVLVETARAKRLAAVPVPAVPEGKPTPADPTGERGGLSATLGGFGNLAAGLGTLALVTKIAEAGREGVKQAREAEVAEAQLGIALGDKLARIADVRESVDALSKSTVFGRVELTSTAQGLVERGVSPDQIKQTLKVATDVASALRLPLNEVSEALAQTFGGTVPRALARAVPALKDLSKEALEAGGALDVLSKAYAGRAEAFARTDAGREVADVRDRARAWEELGRTMLTLERSVLPVLTRELQAVADVAAEMKGPGGKSGADIGDDLIGGLGDKLGVELVGQSPAGKLRDGTGQSAANKAAIDAHRDELHAEAVQATQLAAGLQKELADLDAHGLADTNRRHGEAAAKDAAEAFRLRSIGLDQYLAKLADATAEERGRLKALADATAGDMAYAAADAVEQRNLIDKLSKQLKPTGGALSPADDAANKAHNAQVGEAIDLSRTRLTADLAREVELKRQLIRTNEDLAASDRGLTNDKAKGVEERGKQLAQDAAEAERKLQEVRAQGVRDWNAGTISQADEQAKVNAAVDAYAAAVRLARAELEKLAGVATDDATRKAMADAAEKVTAAAQKQGVDATRPIPPARGHGVVDEDGRPIDTQVTPGRVRSQAGADLAGGEQLQSTAFADMTDRLMAIETHAKSAKAALLDLAESFGKAMLEVADQRLAEAAVSALSGGQKGGGLFGLLGSAAAGDPAGGMAKLAGGGVTTAGTTAVTGTVATTAATAGPALLPATAAPVAAGAPILASTSGTAAGAATGSSAAAGGGVLGGALSSIGKVVAGIGATLAGAVVAIVTAIGGVTAAVAAGTAATVVGFAAQTAAIVAGFAEQAIATAIGAVGGLASLAGFDVGGWTGRGGVKQPRGVVHAEEYVLDAPATAELGVPLLDKLHADPTGTLRAVALAGRAVGAGRLTPRTMAMIVDGVNRGGPASASRIASATTAGVTSAGGVNVGADYSRHAAAMQSVAEQTGQALGHIADIAGRPSFSIMSPEHFRSNMEGSLRANNWRFVREAMATIQKK